jgi:hypothetical protein
VSLSRRFQERNKRNKKIGNFVRDCVANNEEDGISLPQEKHI